MKPTKNVVVKKESHCRKSLSGIHNACRCQIKGFSLLNRCVEDPRYKPSGMTASLMSGLHPTYKESLNGTYRLGVSPTGAASTLENIHCKAGKLSGLHPTYKIYSGFTLIELLVVVLIIGILAAVAVPQYQKAVVKSRMAEALSVLPTLVRASKLYYLANGEYPTNMAELDVEIPAERLSNQWAFGKADNPHTYYYSLSSSDGSWTANAADENLPLLHFKNENRWCIAPKNRWGITKSNMAEELCKSMGTYFRTFDQVDYYQIN